MKIKRDAVKRSFLPRAKTSNKNDFGHVLVIAGSRGMSGAAVLCACACARSGAGLTTLAVPVSIHQIAASKALPEIMTLPLRETPECTIHPSSVKKVFEYIEQRKIGAVAIGPGLKNNRQTSIFVKKILAGFRGNVVLDADGINSVRESDLRTSKANIIITPHQGEFRRLLKKGRGIISENDVVHFAKKNRVICVLKGSGTIISDGSVVLKNTTGNPGMASGGSGDALTGMIAGFIVQIKKPLMAAAAAVYVHGLAGDISAREKTMVSMLPSDIIENISKALMKTGIK